MNRQAPWPSCQITLIRSPRRPQKQNKWPPYGSRFSVSWTNKTQARESFAHVGMASRQPNPNAARNGDHLRQSTTSRMRASASASIPASTRIVRPPASSISSRGCSPRLRSSRCPGGDLGLPRCSGHLVENGDGEELSAANVIDLLNATLTPPSVNQGRIDVVLTGDRADAGARHQCFRDTTCSLNEVGQGRRRPRSRAISICWKATWLSSLFAPWLPHHAAKQRSCLIYARRFLPEGYGPPQSSYPSFRRPFRFVAVTTPRWHIAMPSGEGGNHPISRGWVQMV